MNLKKVRETKDIKKELTESNDSLTDFKWDEKKYQIAADLSSGLYTKNQIANRHNISESTIYRWLTIDAFRTYVDELTLKSEITTKAGMLRAINRGLKIKEMNIADDKSTFLDYLKFAATLSGETGESGKIQIEFNINKPDEVAPTIKIIKPIEIGEEEEECHE